MNLLAKNAPRLFDVLNPREDTPLLVCCDHSGRHIPAALGNLGLEQNFLELHIAFDIGARQVAKRLAHTLNAPLLLANYSRLVIDLNRHPDDPTLIPEVSDGIVILGNAGVSRGQRQQRIDQMFSPYHRRYSAMVDRLQARFVKPIIVSVHSFTPEIQGVRRPWDIGLLWEHHQVLAHSLSANLSENDGLCIGHNQPYHACDPRGYAMAVHAQERDVEMALIEIRQDRIAHRQGQKWAADMLHRALLPLVDWQRRKTHDLKDMVK